MSTRLKTLLVAPLGSLLFIVGSGVALSQEPVDDDTKGVYAPVELRGHEPHDLMETAAQFKEMFERRSLLYQDPAVVGLVRRIGHELAPEPTDDYMNYEFYVIRDPSPNAFAFPNGQIFIHTGMLARMRDESQLAALLAHEISHVAGHHSILSYRITAKRLLIDIFSGGLGGLFGRLKYSRALEQEADDRVPVLLSGTEYDAHAMTELLEILNEDFEGLDPRYDAVWLTHPDPEQRIALSILNLGHLPGKPRNPSAFDEVIYPLRIMTVRDYIQDDYPYTAIAVTDRFMDRYPGDLDFRMALGDAQRQLGPRPPVFPEDFTKKDARRNISDRIFMTREQRMEELLETPEGVAAMAQNLGRALATYERILEIDPEYAPAHRGMGEVHEAQGNDREAGRAYLTYLQQRPDAEDRPIVLARLTGIRDRLLEEVADDE
jgi:tetratricopeptide (TPR) repeat protein